jgi:hypothetical protein
MATALNVDLIATDDDLVAEVASRARLDRANKDVVQRTAIRRSALQDVVDALRTRSPAITEEMLLDPVELKRAVVYRSLAKIFLSAIAVDGDVHQVLYRNYEREYQAAVRAPLSIRPLGGLGSPSGYSVRVGRR